MKKQLLLLSVLFFSAALLYTCSTPRYVKLNPVKRDSAGRIMVNMHPDPTPKSPEESMKNIYLPKGYHLQLVASEPMVSEPVAIAWDGNGRMFVAELNTYMQDIDGTGENKSLSRIKLLEDTNGDGVMDKATVFIDSLLLPRMILPLDGRLLVNETYNENIYSYEDTNGDGKADKKTIVYKTDVADTRNLEHQRSGLIWNLDNRIYVTVDATRYRFMDNKLIPAPMIESGGGQWGLANDDYGRLFFSSAGGENPAFNFQQMPHYGSFNFNDQFNDEFQAVWPIVSTPDVQGGPQRYRKTDSTLNHFTACNGQSIYRGDKLPADMKGDLIICEPVGRLIRRAKVVNTNAKITLVNAYQKEEFIASSDLNFRPVNSATGPDGALYIVDMYHGIIQEGNWTKSDSYLRPQIMKKGLDKNIGRGRIYRVVYDGIKLDKKRPNLLNETPANLVAQLGNPNGWWRDNAQKLLVLRNDKTVVPALEAMVKTGATPLARIHALWTLNGMGSLTKDVLFYAFNDADATVRKTAVWASEDFLADNADEVLAKIDPLKIDANPNVRFQVGLTSRFIKSQKADAIVASLKSSPGANSTFVASQNKYDRLLVDREASSRRARAMIESEKKLVLDGGIIFKQLCQTCHGADGKGITVGSSTPAPSLYANKYVTGDPDKIVKILLHGLKGPIDGKTYPDVMPALGAANDDTYIASVISFIRNDLGNKAKVVTADDVKKIRAQTQSRTTNWTIAELDAK